MKILSEDPAVELVTGLTRRRRRRAARRRSQYRKRLHPAQAACRARRHQHGRCHPARSHQAWQRYRRAAFPAGRPGCQGRRTAGQRRLSVHGHGRHARRSRTVDAEDHGCAAGCARTGGRQFRSRRSGAGSGAEDRPRNGGAPRPHGDADRQHALRRIRPTAGIDDLQRTQPVSRRDGRRAGSSGKAPKR